MSHFLGGHVDSCSNSVCWSQSTCVLDGLSRQEGGMQRCHNETQEKTDCKVGSSMSLKYNHCDTINCEQISRPYSLHKFCFVGSPILVEGFRHYCPNSHLPSPFFVGSVPNIVSLDTEQVVIATAGRSL